MGPTDFLQMDAHLYDSTSLPTQPPSSAESQYLGCTDGLPACAPSTVERANPIHLSHLVEQGAAVSHVHGDADTLVPHWESEILFSALTSSSVCADATFYTMHGQGHLLFFTGALNPPYPTDTVQSSKGCSAVSTTDGPTLTWDTLATFFTSTSPEPRRSTAGGSPRPGRAAEVSAARPGPRCVDQLPRCLLRKPTISPITCWKTTASKRRRCAQERQVAVVGALHHVAGAVHPLGEQRGVQDQRLAGRTSWSALPCSNMNGGAEALT